MGLKKVFNGSNWCIYYLKINDFVHDLNRLGEVLEKLSSIGRIVAIIPDIGHGRKGVFRGLGFKGVKGLAIVLEKKKVFEKLPTEV